MLGQFGDWGAYKATPGGKKVCFALAKPSRRRPSRPVATAIRPIAFISTRPAEKVKNEVSVIVGYPQKASTDATATIGAANFAMYTQNDGAWIKNAAEEAQMVDAMRKGATSCSRANPGAAPRAPILIRSRASPGARQGRRRSANDLCSPSHRGERE